MPTPHADPCAFVIMGVTGDLAARKLMPALYELHLMGALHQGTRIVGMARGELSDEAFRRRMKEALQEHSPASFDEARWRELEPRLSYLVGRYDDVGAYRRLTATLEGFGEATAGNRVFYLSVPPSVFRSVIRGLHAVGLNAQERGWSRLVIEKPFGHDLASAEELNAALGRAFQEEQIYRIDHYLGKETAQNIAALRFANTLFEPTWNNQFIDHVQVTVAENLGVEGRGSFYEEAGVLRDIIQNHVLQLVALTATEAPARYDARSVRDEKVKVLRAMRCVRPQDAVKGQYAGAEGAKGYLAGYLEEDGVAKDSGQGTYLAAAFHIDNWRWAGVPFFVRSGKRLKAKASEIVLRFKTPPHLPFSLAEPPAPDALVLRLQPDEGISLRFNVKVPGSSLRLQGTSMDFTYDRGFERENPDAYETLLLDVMRGDATLFMRADEILAQWAVVAPLLEAWDEIAPVPYLAGSWGPEAADRLLAATGRQWQVPGNGPTG